MFLTFPILLKCISLCRLPCCGRILPKPTTVLICTRTVIAVHRLGTTCANLCPVLGPGHLVGMLLWYLFCFQVVHVQKEDLSHLTLGMGLSSSLCTSSLDKCLCAHLLWTKAFVFIWLAPDFDRHISHTSCSKVSCYSANGVWAKPLSLGRWWGGKGKGQKGKAAAPLGEAGSRRWGWRVPLLLEGMEVGSKGGLLVCIRIKMWRQKTRSCPIIWRHQLNLTCTFNVRCLKMMSMRLTAFVSRS